jgi:hypothetical protein
VPVDGETARSASASGRQPVDDARRRRVLYGTLIDMQHTPSQSPGRGSVARHVRQRRLWARRPAVTGSVVAVVLVLVAVAVVTAVAGLRVLREPAPATSGLAARQRVHRVPSATAAAAPRPRPGRASIPHTPPRRAPPGTATGWAAVLRRLDAARAVAWLRGDPALLRRVYVTPSPALRRDQRALSGYLHRGLVVRGVHLRFARVRLLARRPRLVTLRVIDRLGAMTAVDEGGGRMRLPRDQPTHHVLTLRRTVDRWRIAAVRTR